MSRIAVRKGAAQVLHDLPLVSVERVIEVPAVVVSTPREEVLDTGFVSGNRDTVLTVEVTVYEKTEDAVDAMLAEVEKRFADDPSLGGTVQDLAFVEYDLEWDEPIFTGTQSWTSTPIGGFSNG